MSITLTFEGRWVGYIRGLVKCLYMIVLYVLLFLLVLAIVFGSIGSSEMTIELHVNRLNSPFYKIGLFSERYPLDDGSVEDEIVIAFFFFTIVVVFWKQPND